MLWLSFTSYSYYLLGTALVRDEALAITHSGASMGLSSPKFKEPKKACLS